MSTGGFDRPYLSPTDQRLVVNVAYAVCAHHDDYVDKPCPRCLRVVRNAVTAVRRDGCICHPSETQATPSDPASDGPTDCVHCGQRIRRFGQTRRWCHDETGHGQCAATATCPHGAPLTAPHCQGCDDLRDGVASLETGVSQRSTVD